MAKHVKIQVASLPQFDKALVRIVAQTNFGVYFGGNAGWDTRKFRASNGVVLASNQFPARDKEDKNIIWLQGFGPADKQGTTIAMPKVLAEKVKVAVAEYNEFYADKAPVCAAPGTACCVTVG